MSRLLYKGPYIDEKLMKKVQAQKKMVELKLRLKHGLDVLRFHLNLSDIPFWYIREKTLLRYMFLSLWLDIGWVNLHQPEHLEHTVR